MSDVSMLPTPNRTPAHGLEFFYKYMSARGAISTLHSLSTRWSSPLLFNDPFDTHFGLTFGFSLDELPEPYASRWLALVASDEPLSPDTPKALAAAIRCARLVRQRIPRELYQNGMREAALEGVENARTFLAKANEDWQLRLRIMRTFCVCEVHDNLLLWAHYADCHRGVALRLKCLPDKDTVLCAARPVIYSKKIPALADTVDEWVAHAFGDRRIDLTEIFQKLVFTKSDHWKYEQEWRCLTEERDLQPVAASLPDDQLIQYSILDPDEVSAVYLGCRMDPGPRGGAEARCDHAAARRDL